MAAMRCRQIPAAGAGAAALPQRYLFDQADRISHPNRHTVFFCLCLQRGQGRKIFFRPVYSAPVAQPDQIIFVSGSQCGRQRFRQLHKHAPPLFPHHSCHEVRQLGRRHGACIAPISARCSAVDRS